MAQKLGLAFIALFGLANCQVQTFAEYRVANHQDRENFGPAVTFGGKNHEDKEEEGDHNGPILGESEVHVGYGILNFANDASDKRREKESDEHQQRPTTIIVVKKSEKRQKESLRKDDDDHDQDNHLKRKSQEHHEQDSRPKKKEVKEQENHTRRQERSDQDHRPRKSEHREQQNSHSEPIKVPIFTKLKYVDNDPHGQSVKAPITIVTAPLVSTAKQEQHRVGVNQVVGKSNCPQCLEDNHEAAETKKSAGKAIQRYDNLLSTQIKAPIKNPVVKDEDHHEQKQEKKRRKNDDDDGSEDEDRVKINQKKLRKDLALGEARENAPFVVGAPVIFSKSNLRQDDDHHRREDNSRKDHD